MTTEDGHAARGAALARLRQILEAEEGRRTRVYADTRGRLTVGIGHLVLPDDRLNAGDVISEARVDALFAKDAARALAAASSQAAEAGVTDAEFVARLAAVNFQLGSGWTAVFPKTWGLIVAGAYGAAADGLASSLWARQTPRRVAAFQAALRRLAGGASPDRHAAPAPSAASPHWPVLFHGSGGAMGGVVHNDWGFRPGQKVTIWRRAPR